MRIVRDQADDGTPAARRRNAVLDYVEARQLEDRSHELRLKAEARLLEVLDEEELKSASVEKDGVRYLATASSRTTTTFDEAGLKKALGAATYNKLTTARLDKTKLERAVEEGTVDPRVVAQHASINHGTRSLRLTRKVSDDSGGPAAS